MQPQSQQSAPPDPFTSASPANEMFMNTPSMSSMGHGDLDAPDDKAEAAAPVPVTRPPGTEEITVEIVESIYVHFAGSEVSKCAINGEIRVKRGPRFNPGKQGKTVVLRLAGANRIDQVSCNPLFAKQLPPQKDSLGSGSGAEDVNLDFSLDTSRLQTVAEDVAVKYRLMSAFRPVPLKVVPQWDVRNTLICLENETCL
jgi:hypothetical protein